MNRIDPDHSIIDQPWTYDVTGFSYHRSVSDPEDRWLDLVLCKGTEVRRLRFLRPQKISVSEDFPECLGLYIADVSARGLEGLRVHVGDFEACGGGIEFWAADVVDLDSVE